MKTIVFPEYGSPDVLQLIEADKPVPGEGRVLVKIIAASVNPLDWHRMRAEPFLVRTSEGLRKPQNPKLGADIAGRVVAVGPGVTQFKPGDAVFGEVSSGGFAEYIAARETRLALKPDNITFEQAAAVPVAAFTAIQGLRNTGKIQAGQKVLVNGASGGVGHFAVQMARAYGAEVTAVCSARNHDMVRSIGASHVIDYTREDFTQGSTKYDLIYDAIGNRSVGAYRRALKPGGRCVIAGFTTLSGLFAHIIIGGLTSRWSDKTVGIMPTANPNSADLQAIRELLAAGKVVPVIDRCYSLAETPEAIRYLETMRARGKVIINIASDN